MTAYHLTPDVQRRIERSLEDGGHVVEWYMTYGGCSMGVAVQALERAVGKGLAVRVKVRNLTMWRRA